VCELLIIFSTVPDTATAQKIAAALLDEGLAACVHIGAAIEARYRWQGVVETATEIPLTIKTTRQRYPELEKRLTELHPYEVPECIAVNVAEVSQTYGEWINNSVHKPAVQHKKTE
jgi:periplasmic divalent cation tolerance protein